VSARGLYAPYGAGGVDCAGKRRDCRLLTFPISRIEIHSRDVLFIAAVIVASRYAGATAGLSAALLSVLVFDWFFDPTPHVLDFTLAGLVQAVVFGSVSLLAASVSERNRLLCVPNCTKGRNRNSFRLRPLCLGAMGEDILIRRGMPQFPRNR
jgi:hypothetical protein